MDSRRHLMERFADVPAALPGQPVIEISSDRRVLIENHCGVKEYGHEQIIVQVPFGCVCIMGHNLELMRMTKEQLVICGNIQCLRMQRKGSA